MITEALLDSAEIASACQRYGVARLRVFGSALTDRFDDTRSDVDLLVDYLPDSPRTFQTYFALRDELTRLLGRPVDLVDARAVRNPYFARSALRGAREIYAA